MANFAKIFFKNSKFWKENPWSFGNCFYHLNHNQFLKLQRYAQAGSIICTIGNINDLEFLGAQKVAMVDVSNIPDYAQINLKGLKKSTPQIVWTYLNQLAEERTKYCSCKYELLNENELREFDRLYSIFVGSFDEPRNGEGILHACCSTNTALCARSKLGLKALREYVAENILEISGVGCFNLSIGCVPRRKILELEDSKMIRLITAIQKNQQRLALIRGLIHEWEELPFHQLSMLINDNQWLDAFEVYFQEYSKDLSKFIAVFKAANAYEELEQKFGRDRLQKLQHPKV